MRRRDAMKRLGAPLCPVCDRQAEELLLVVDTTFTPARRYEACAACRRRQDDRNKKHYQQELKQQAEREARDSRWVDAAPTGNHRWYRDEYGEHAEDIEAALAGWQIGNGIVGPRR